MQQPKYLSDRLFFDIETTVHPRANELVGLDEVKVGDLTVAQLKQVLDESGLAISGTKPELIERAVSRRSSEKLMEMLASVQKERDAEKLEKAPLDPDLGAVRAIGWVSGDGIIEVNVAETDESKLEFLPQAIKTGPTKMKAIRSDYVSGADAERDLIALFWKTAETHDLRLVGANVLNFDLPFLLRRSMELKIRVPPKLSLRRYQTEPICDTMQILSHWGAFKFKSLKFFCQRYGIYVPVPHADGSMVEDMDNSALALYLASDVWVTRELWRMMDGVYWPEIVDVPNPFR